MSGIVKDDFRNDSGHSEGEYALWIDQCCFNLLYIHIFTDPKICPYSWPIGEKWCFIPKKRCRCPRDFNPLDKKGDVTSSFFWILGNTTVVATYTGRSGSFWHQEQLGRCSQEESTRLCALSRGRHLCLSLIAVLSLEMPWSMMSLPLTIAFVHWGRR